LTYGTDLDGAKMNTAGQKSQFAQKLSSGDIHRRTHVTHIHDRLLYLDNYMLGNSV